MPGGLTAKHPGEKSALEPALALLAAVVGAGFASGRETVVFFSRFGAYSWLGIGAASALFGLLAASIMRLCALYASKSFTELASGVLGRAGGYACSSLYAAMLLITAGAMASGIAEVAAVTLYIPHVREIGLVTGVILCVICAGRGMKALAAGGSFLLPVCALLYAMIIRYAPQPPVISSSPPADVRLALPMAVGYACMNITLCVGILSEVGAQSGGIRRRNITLWFTALIAGLLYASNAAITPHIQRVLNEPLPMVRLTRGLFAGRILATVALLLAMATTLTALLRSASRMLPSRWPQGLSLALCGAMSAACGMIGFNRLIGAAYPIMGILCAVALAAVLITGQVKARRRR